MNANAFSTPPQCFFFLGVNNLNKTNHGNYDWKKSLLLTLLLEKDLRPRRDIKAVWECFICYLDLGYEAERTQNWALDSVAFYVITFQYQYHQCTDVVLHLTQKCNISCTPIYCKSFDMFQNQMLRGRALMCPQYSI